MDVVIVIEGMAAKVDYESKRWGRTVYSKGSQRFFRDVESC